MYDVTNLSLSDFFIGYATIAIIGIVGTFVWPRGHPRPLQESVGKEADMNGFDEEEKNFKKEKDAPAPSVKVSSKMIGKPFIQQALTVEYLGGILLPFFPFLPKLANISSNLSLALGFCIVSVVCFNFYMGTIPLQLEEFVKDRETSA